MKYSLRIAFAVAVLAISSHADVIVNTFGPDYGLGDTATVISRVPFYESIAVAFTPATTVTATQLDFGLLAADPVNHLEIDLTADNYGLPGNTIQSWNVQLLATGQPDITAVLGNVLLQGGTQYWITVSAMDDNTSVGWFVNPLGLRGLLAFDTGFGWNNDLGAELYSFDVIGTPVPEPATLCLLGTAALAIAGVLRRKLE